MRKEKVSTNKRLFSLVKQRIEVLNEEEQNLLVAGTNSVRRLLLLLAVCKAHSFIFDFIFIICSSRVGNHNRFDFKKNTAGDFSHIGAG